MCQAWISCAKLNFTVDDVLRFQIGYRKAIITKSHLSRSRVPEIFVARRIFFIVNLEKNPEFYDVMRYFGNIYFTLL